MERLTIPILLCIIVTNRNRYTKHFALNVFVADNRICKCNSLVTSKFQRVSSRAKDG